LSYRSLFFSVSHFHFAYSGGSDRTGALYSSRNRGLTNPFFVTSLFLFSISISFSVLICLHPLTFCLSDENG
jgi:hypothetical protein